MRSKRAINLLLIATLVVIPIVGFWQRQNIYDWAKLYGYDPPAAIASLAAANTMNDHAKHIFYVNHPELVSESTTFRQNCSSDEQTIILGCYHPDQNGIFVFDVKDERLGGIEEVTSAHEMLHAAYDRLSGDDKKYVDGLLQDYYQNHLTDERIKQTIEAYKQSEPTELVNEMHSIFGTEVAELPKPLEDYYKRYFMNRAVVVAFSQRYESEFTSRSAKAAQYEKQIEALKAKITAKEAELRAQLERIKAEQTRLDSLRASGQTEQYNAGVVAYNAEVDAYNTGVAQYKRDVNTYNSLVEQYNAIAGELKQLYGAIDTRLTTQPAR